MPIGDKCDTVQQKFEVKTLEAFFKNTERENNSEVEKVGRKNSVIWDHKYSDSIHVDLNHTNSIINCNHKDYDLIQVDLNNNDLIIK